MLQDKAYLVKDEIISQTIDFKEMNLKEGFVDISKMYMDKNGSVWFFSDLVRYNGTRTMYFNKEDGLCDDRVNAVFHDREGNLWVGSRLGLDKFSEPKFNVFGEPEGLNNPFVNAILENKPGELWVATDDGLSIFDPSNEKLFTSFADPKLKIRIRHLYKDKGGEIWASTYGSGLIGIRDYNIERTISEADGLVGNKVRTVSEDSNGNLWVGTTSGISVIDKIGRITNYSVKSGLKSEYIMCFQEDSRGRMWVGTDGGGAFIFENGKIIQEYNKKNGFSGDVIYRFYEDSDKAMWITTMGGITRVTDNETTNFASDNSLIKDTMFQIIEDKMGKFWMTSNNGVYSLDKNALLASQQGGNNKASIELFGEKSGLRQGPTATAWGITDTEGNLWIPTLAGLATINPRNISKNDYPPQVAIEKVILDSGEIYLVNNQLDIKPGEKRITFSFAALSFTSVEDVQTQYILEGFDENWSNFEHKHFTTYTNLPNGTYIFKVKAMNCDGVISET